MRKNYFLKKGVACVLSAAMLLTGAGVMPCSESTAKAATADITSGLVAYYPFDGTLDNIATENGKAKLHGGAGGDTWGAAPVGEATYADGKKGKAFDFQGGANNVPGNNGLELDAKITGDAYTISFWAQIDNYNQFSSLFFANSGAGQFNIAENWGGASFPTIRCAEFKDKADIYLDAGPQPAAGTWAYITATYADGVLSLYRDGEIAKWNNVDSIKTDVAHTLSGLKNQALFLGVNWWDATIDGRIDDFALYSRALSADDVAALYAEENADASKLELAVTAEGNKTTLTNKNYGEGIDVTDSVQLSAEIVSQTLPMKISKWEVVEGPATVSETGKVTSDKTAKKGDKVKVKVTNTYGVSGEIELTVDVVEATETNKVASVAVADMSLELGYTHDGKKIVPQGTSGTPSVTLTGEDAGTPVSIDVVEYSTDAAGEKVVKFEDGKVVAVGLGKATVTATSMSSSKKSGKFDVTVTEKAPVSYTCAGSADKGSGYTSQKGDFDFVYLFRNKSKATANWDNFMLQITDGTSKFNVYRADQWSEKQELGKIEWTKNVTDDGDLKWSDFNAELKEGADVRVRVKREGNELTVKYVITGSKHVFPMTATCTCTGLPDVIYTQMSGNFVEITNLTLGEVPQYSISLAPDTVTTFDNGTIKDIDTTKKYAEGDIVSISTKPAAGYTADITVSYTGGTVETSAEKSASGEEIVSFVMPEGNVTLTYNGFKGVNRTAVEAAVTAAKATFDAGNADDKYTVSSWSAFSTAYNTAVNVKDSSSSTQGEVDSAAKALTDAQAGLVFACTITGMSKEIYLGVGGTETLSPVVKSEGSDKSLTWTTSNADVATVEGGLVTAVAAGTAIITATAADGTKATCEVVVTGSNSSVGTGTGNVTVNTPGASTEPTAKPEKVTVGSEGMTSEFLTAFSDHYRLSGDFNFNIEFENHGGTEGWNNFSMLFTNQNATAAAEQMPGYAEYALIRADNCGWGWGRPLFSNIAYSGSAIGYKLDPEGVNFADVLKDASVKLNITRKGSDVTIVETVKSNLDESKKYTSTVTFKAGSDDGKDDGTGDIYFTLTVDKSYLIIDTASISGDSAGAPSTSPSASPSTAPSTSPSTEPTQKPSQAPSTQPSVSPSTEPTQTPSEKASLTLSRSKATIYTGKASNKVTIGVSVTGESNVVTWRTSNAKVAKVTAAGENVVISAVGKGSATITATANGISKTVKVTVKNPTITVKNGKKNAAKVSVKRNKTVKLTVTTNPKKAGISLAKLSSKDKKVVSASLKSGKLTIKGKKKGKVVLSVKSGKAVKKITVTVK